MYKNPIVIGSTILAVGFLLCAIVGSYTFYQIRAEDNQLSVTGSAKQQIVSDSAKWTVTISRPATASTLKTGYTQVASDLALVKTYFSKNGFTQSQLEISTVFMDEVYDNNNSYIAPEQKRYTLRQTITLASSDVQKVSALSQNTQDIISQGVIFSAQPPEYSYSDLATLRVTLLANALKDAKDRADSIASMTSNKVGKLKSASSGVVQVLNVGSAEVSDYGAYDTSNINKDVMVTVHASFILK